MLPMKEVKKARSKEQQYLCQQGCDNELSLFVRVPQRKIGMVKERERDMNGRETVLERDRTRLKEGQGWE